MSRFATGMAAICTLAIGAVTAAGAGVVVYEEGAKKIEIGARVQIQYLRVDPDGGQSRDDTFFRRLRPYIAGTVTEDWYAKVQFDLGKSLDNNEVAIKDAYMKYSGFSNENLSLTIGNAKSPFSREFLTSSKRQQLIERTFTGDHNFGVPDRQLGLLLAGKNKSKKVAYEIGVGAENHDPNAKVLDFDSPVDNASDWNEGLLASGRVDFHPRGAMKFDQGDFHADEWKYTIGASAFTWNNDDDVNSYTDPMTGLSLDPDKADLDNASGGEFSAGVRGKGVSVDVAVQKITAETVDSMFTGGIYVDGESDLDKLSLEGGYMVAKNVEVVAGWESLDTDGYNTEWKRTSVGVNLFFNKHKAKLQMTYRMATDVDGVAGQDVDSTFVQSQFVF